jgi:cobalt/nickel transport system permease protein
MEHGFIDRYSSLESCIHRLDTRTRILAALGFLAVVVSTPPWHLQAFVIYAGLISWITALSRVPLRFVASRAALVLPFSALVALGLPFIGGGEKVVFFGIPLAVNGLWILAGAIMKSFLGAVAIVLLVSTTPFGLLLDGLRRLKAPALFIDLLALTYRYLFILVDESQRLRRAARARGYAPRWLPQAVVIGRLIGNLFVRSYRRAERIYNAMRLRGYDGQIPAAQTRPFSLSESLLLAVIILALVSIRIIAA